MLFVDANIILEIFFKREKAKYCLDICQKYDNLCLSPTSLHIIYYYAEKSGLSLNELQKMLADIIILPFHKKDFELALEIFEKKDMEDALQIAVAVNNKVEAIFTLDQQMITKYQSLVEFAG